MKAVSFNYLACPSCGQALTVLVDVPVADQHSKNSRAVCCGNEECEEYLKGGIDDGTVVELRDAEFQVAQ